MSPDGFDKFYDSLLLGKFNQRVWTL